jgi:hypothetical protein
MLWKNMNWFLFTINPNFFTAKAKFVVTEKGIAGAGSLAPCVSKPFPLANNSSV